MSDVNNVLSTSSQGAYPKKFKPIDRNESETANLVHDIRELNAYAADPNTGTLAAAAARLQVLDKARLIPGAIVYDVLRQTVFGCSTNSPAPTLPDKLKDGGEEEITPDAGGTLIRPDAQAIQEDGPIGDTAPLPDSTEATPPSLAGPQMFQLTGDRDQLMGIQVPTIYLVGGEGLKNLPLGLKFAANSKLIDPNDPNFPCVPGVICVSKDDSGTYYIDPSVADNNLPVTFLSYTLTDQYTDNPEPVYTKNYADQTPIGAICGQETYTDPVTGLVVPPVIGDIPMAFNASGTLNAALAPMVSVDTSQAIYNAQYDYRVVITVFMMNPDDGGVTPTNMPVKRMLQLTVIHDKNNKLIDPETKKVYPLLNKSAARPKGNLVPHPANKYTVIGRIENVQPKAVQE